MRYRIILYDRATDEAVASSAYLASIFGPRILAIAGAAERRAGEIPLDQDQISEIAKLIGFAADVSRFHYHLEPVAPGARQRFSVIGSRILPLDLVEHRVDAVDVRVLVVQRVPGPRQSHRVAGVVALVKLLPARK